MKPLTRDAVVLVIEQSARFADDAERFEPAGRTHHRPAARGRLLGRTEWPRPDRRQGHPQGDRRPKKTASTGSGERALEVDHARHHADRHRRRQGRARSTASASRSRRFPLRPADPHHRPHRPRHRRGGGHRARGRARRPAPFQGRADPVRLPGGDRSARTRRCRCRPAWSSSNPMAASTATARPRPSSMPCCRRSPSVPIKQSFAVTGSVNQLGEVQAIGGVNEKIEGFFDICNEPRPDRRAGRPDPGIQHQAPDAAPRRGRGGRARGKFQSIRWRPSTRGSSCLTGIAGGRARQGRRVPDRHHLPQGRGPPARDGGSPAEIRAAARFWGNEQWPSNLGHGRSAASW